MINILYVLSRVKKKFLNSLKGLAIVERSTCKMEIKPIKTEADYDAALLRVEELWGSIEGTPEDDEFEILFTLIEAYEEEHYPVGPPLLLKP